MMAPLSHRVVKLSSLVVTLLLSWFLIVSLVKLKWLPKCVFRSCFGFLSLWVTLLWQVEEVRDECESVEEDFINMESTRTASMEWHPTTLQNILCIPKGGGIHLQVQTKTSERDHPLKLALWVVMNTVQHHMDRTL